MNETLTRAEIAERFPNEWILVIDPDTGPDLMVRSGIVVAHSADRDTVYRKAIELRPKHSAVWFNGDPVPPGTAVLL
jgi:hypothetical protein